MRTRFLILAVVLIFAFAGFGKAETVTLDLFSLGMPATYNDDSPSWQTSFDFGVTFTEISHVYIDWSGEFTGGWGSSPSNPQLHPLPVGILASLGGNPYSRMVEILGGVATSPAPEPFDLASEINDEGSNWSDLLDGQGRFSINYTEIIMSNGGYVQHGSVSLDSATLVVDGTLTPEPASLLLLALGTVGHRLIRPKRCNNSVQ
jgi:hypothetical protein